MLARVSVLFVVLELLARVLGATEPGALERLSWMAGCWSFEQEGRLNEECWLHPAGDVMLGVNRTSGGGATAFEFLRIERDGDGIVLLASPSGKPATSFRRVDGGESFVVFENPGHDFPQRITYRREGDRLTARVEAREGDGWSGFDQIWTRAPIEGPPAAPARSLEEAESAFARSLADGDREGFASFLADDAVFATDSVTRGKEAILDAWSVFFAVGGPELVWSPETVEVRARGDLGMTRGPYTLEATTADGTPITESGTFTSIWELAPDGSWRIVFDAGCPVGP